MSFTAFLFSGSRLWCHRSQVPHVFVSTVADVTLENTRPLFAGRGGLILSLGHWCRHVIVRNCCGRIHLTPGAQSLTCVMLCILKVGFREQTQPEVVQHLL